MPQTINYYDAGQHLAVQLPAGEIITIKAWGAGGGGSEGGGNGTAYGGAGGYFTATFTLSSSTTANFYVGFGGGNGRWASPAGTGGQAFGTPGVNGGIGGANLDWPGAGGGAYTKIEIGSDVVILGGGGGAGGDGSGGSSGNHATGGGNGDGSGGLAGGGGVAGGAGSPYSGGGGGSNLGNQPAGSGGQGGQNSVTGFTFSTYSLQPGGDGGHIDDGEAGIPFNAGDQLRLGRERAGRGGSTAQVGGGTANLPGGDGLVILVIGTNETTTTTSTTTSTTSTTSTSTTTTSTTTTTTTIPPIPIEFVLYYIVDMSFGGYGGVHTNAKLYANFFRGLPYLKNNAYVIGPLSTTFAGAQAATTQGSYYNYNDEDLFAQFYPTVPVTFNDGEQGYDIAIYLGLQQEDTTLYVKFWEQNNPANFTVK